MSKDLVELESDGSEAFSKWMSKNDWWKEVDASEEDFVGGYVHGWQAGAEEYWAKLREIEDLMHPGYWGTYDERRDRILKILGSTREIWSRDPYVG